MTESTAPLPEPARAAPISDAIFRVARLHRLLAGQLLRETGLYAGQQLVMMQLWDAGPQRQVDLIRVLDSDAATMTRTITRLENAGFVRRRPCPTDRRATLIEPTVASQALRRQVEQVWSQLEQLTIAELTETEQTTVLNLLHRLEHTLADSTHATETCGPPPGVTPGADSRIAPPSG
ncbi:MAG TPA: MarR family transcriptional regulator [Pseudonocardiaceae bacterium]|jgi:DNA-binding MarR family transcriptional regulator|nr:MarR family transcriptional regulator [Pseudonocardiaceae bacterium]